MVGDVDVRAGCWVIILEVVVGVVAGCGSWGVVGGSACAAEELWVGAMVVFDDCWWCIFIICE